MIRLRLPRHLQKSTIRQKRTALIWMLAVFILDQAFLRLIVTHYPTEAPAHMVRIGGWTTSYYIGTCPAAVHAALLLLCVGGGVAAILLPAKRRGANS